MTIKNGNKSSVSGKEAFRNAILQNQKSNGGNEMKVVDGKVADDKVVVTPNNVTTPEKKNDDVTPAPKVEEKKGAEPKQKLFYENVVDAIKVAKIPGISLQEKSIYIGVYKDGKKLVGINKSKIFRIFFHDNRTLEVGKGKDNFQIVTKADAKKNHYGSVVALYTGANIDLIVNCIRASAK